METVCKEGEINMEIERERERRIQKLREGNEDTRRKKNGSKKQKGIKTKVGYNLGE